MAVKWSPTSQLGVTVGGVGSTYRFSQGEALTWGGSGGCWASLFPHQHPWAGVSMPCLHGPSSSSLTSTRPSPAPSLRWWDWLRLWLIKTSFSWFKHQQSHLLYLPPLRGLLRSSWADSSEKKELRQQQTFCGSSPGEPGAGEPSLPAETPNTPSCVLFLKKRV